jgi:polysaccharide deacetylase
VRATAGRKQAVRGMSIRKVIGDAWRKNSTELVGWFNGSLPAFVTARKPRELDGVPVFCYHLVRPEQLEADLEFLRRNGYHALTADAFLAYLNGWAAISPRAVVLTFDDGPRNFYEVAYPLLRKHETAAVAFIAPGLHTDAGSRDDTSDRPMTWQEIREIHDSGWVAFESHTMESRYVPDWPRPAPLAGCAPAIEAARRRPPRPFAEDVFASRAAIAARLPGSTVEHLSFPMYHGSESAVREAESSGFRACHWGLVPGRPLNRRGDSPFQISRLSDEFVRRLPGERRASLGDLCGERLRRARAARAWRRRFGA